MDLGRQQKLLDELGTGAQPSVRTLRSAYLAGLTTPREVVERVHRQIVERGEDGVWITVAELSALQRRADELMRLPDPEALPLYGVPFGVKDSIDIAGWPTTLACPAYATVAEQTAPVVSRLLAAGAILVGKTNLDQFATGLNGTRTPYPIPTSVYGQGLISGGSSSGSALAVALGEVPFTVATDTAGSGRVPPALNGVVGFKPSRGLISTVGLVPACRSLDCVSLIATTCEDLALLLDVVAAPDPRDPWNRKRPDHRPPGDHGSAPSTSRSVPSDVRVGLPDEGELEFFGDTAMAAAHGAARARVAETFSSVVTPPLQPFLAAGALLYQGPWVAERLVEFGDFLDSHPGAALPVVEQIIRGGDRFSAVDVFRAQYRLAELKAEVGRLWQEMDLLVLPTIGTTFTVDEVLAEPIATNTTLGHYTHFGNLLDLCAVAVPTGTTDDGRPVSTMVLGPALADDLVLAVAARLAPLLSTSRQPHPAEDDSRPDRSPGQPWPAWSNPRTASHHQEQT